MFPFFTDQQPAPKVSSANILTLIEMSTYWGQPNQWCHAQNNGDDSYTWLPPFCHLDGFFSYCVLYALYGETCILANVAMHQIWRRFFLPSWQWHEEGSRQHRACSRAKRIGIHLWKFCLWKCRHQWKCTTTCKGNGISLQHLDKISS